MSPGYEAGLRAEYARQAHAYDRRWAAYTRHTLALLRPWLGRPAGALLDVGCGTGALLPRLAEWGVAPRRYVGVDPVPAMLGRAAPRLRPGDALAAAPAGALPFRDGSFDRVVSASSLHYWPDAAAGLREARRVLAPGGRLLVLDWSADYLAVRLTRAWLRLTGRRVARVYRERELARAVGEAGFRRVRSRRARATPAWGMVVVEGVAG